ncbi:MAG: transposase [Alteromonadaceae bacterium]|nr:transposase [Alteromonadaceae bacterium]
MSWDDLRKGRFSQPHREYFITFNCQNRRRLFTNFELAQIFCHQLCMNERKYDYCWLVWVLMPEHFHGILQLGCSELSKVIGTLKGASAKGINEKLNCNSKVWQPSFYDHALRKEENRIKIARYIVANPLRKKLVKNIGDYPYWNSVYL